MAKRVFAVEAAEAVSKKYNIPLAELVDVFGDIPELTAHWVHPEDDYEGNILRCSACNNDVVVYDDDDVDWMDYCPFCGAKMEHNVRWVRQEEAQLC